MVDNLCAGLAIDDLGELFCRCCKAKVDIAEDLTPGSICWGCLTGDDSPGIDPETYGPDWATSFASTGKGRRAVSDVVRRLTERKAAADTAVAGMGTKFPRWQIRLRDGEMIYGEYSWMDGGDGPEPEWEVAEESDDPDDFIAVRVGAIETRNYPKVTEEQDNE